MLPPVLAANKHHKLSSVMALMFQALYDNSIDVGRTTKKPTAFLTAGNISFLLFFNTEINKQASDCCCQLV